MKSRQRGVALIELALSIPLLLLLTFMTTEFGRAIYQYNVLTKSVRDAVRYLSVQVPGSHALEARNLVVFGKTVPTVADAPLASGLLLSHVQAPVWQTAGTGPVINTVTITVSGYRFVSMFNSVFGNNFGTFTYNNISATMRAPL